MTALKSKVERLEKSQREIKSMARKVQGAEKSSGKNPRVPLVPHLEIFSKAVAEGHSHVEAAEICGRSRGSASSLYTRPGVKERIAELRAIAATANEKAVAENGRQEVPVIDFSRNHIVVGIHELAREARSERVRLAAWSKLAEIFMLLPRQTKDLNDFHGWTDDELQYFIHNNEFPPRIKMLLGTLFSDPVQSEIKKESSAESRIAAPGQSEGDDFPPRSF